MARAEPHRITAVDEAARTGMCSVCQCRVDLYLLRKEPSLRWQCRVARRAAKHRTNTSDAGRARGDRRRQTDQYQAYRREYNQRGDVMARKRQLRAEQAAIRAAERATLPKVDRPTRKRTGLRRRGERRPTYAKYGLTAEQYAAMIEAQGNACAICNREERLVIDHDHATGRVRQLLCNGCNAGIGFLRESRAALESAAAYLDRHCSA